MNSSHLAYIVGLPFHFKIYLKLVFLIRIDSFGEFQAFRDRGTYFGSNLLVGMHNIREGKAHPGVVSLQLCFTLFCKINAKLIMSVNSTEIAAIVFRISPLDISVILVSLEDAVFSAITVPHF